MISDGRAYQRIVFRYLPATACNAIDECDCSFSGKPSWGWKPGNCCLEEWSDTRKCSAPTREFSSLILPEVPAAPLPSVIEPG